MKQLLQLNLTLYNRIANIHIEIINNDNDWWWYLMMLHGSNRKNENTNRYNIDNNSKGWNNSNDDYYITVIGDTSPEGPIAYNAKLAHRRADAVIKVLRNLGVKEDKLDVHYFTEDIPIVSSFMLKRQHRVVALVHSPEYLHIPEWNIFTTENKLKSQRGQ